MLLELGKPYESPARTVRYPVVFRVGFSRPTSEQLALALDELEHYECWVPFERLIRSQISLKNKFQKEYYLRLAKIYYLHFEDGQLLIDLVKEIVKELGLEYAFVRDQLLPIVVDGEDFKFEAELLEALKTSIQSKAQQVAIYERLCLIYEKKTL